MDCAECGRSNYLDDTDFLCEECRVTRMTCCTPTPTVGVVPVWDKRWFGGLVDKKGNRHDPMTHAPDCPEAKMWAMRLHYMKQAT